MNLKIQIVFYPYICRKNFDFVFASQEICLSLRIEEMENGVRRNAKINLCCSGSENDKNKNEKNAEYILIRRH